MSKIRGFYRRLTRMYTYLEKHNTNNTDLCVTPDLCEYVSVTYT